MKKVMVVLVILVLGSCGFKRGWNVGIYAAPVSTLDNKQGLRYEQIDENPGLDSYEKPLKSRGE